MNKILTICFIAWVVLGFNVYNASKKAVKKAEQNKNTKLSQLYTALNIYKGELK